MYRRKWGTCAEHLDIWKEFIVIKAHLQLSPELGVSVGFWVGRSPFFRSYPKWPFLLFPGAWSIYLESMGKFLWIP